MTKEDIIRMAIEAGWDAHHAEFDTRIQTFAALVASAEREACAKLCETIGNTQANMNAAWRNGCRDVAIEIRARGNHD